MSRTLTELGAAEAEVIRLRSALSAARLGVLTTTDSLGQALEDVRRLKKAVSAEKRRAFVEMKPMRAAAAREAQRKRLARRGFAAVARRSF